MLLRKKRKTVKDSGAGIDHIKIERFNSAKKLLSKSRTKISGMSRRPARETLIIDREKHIRIHKVEEQQENQDWKVVHDEKKPLQKRKRGLK